jgi:GntP family gluconate:H+ symporter
MNPDAISYWPFVVLAIGILVVITLIAGFRIHAFVALIVSAVVVGFLSKGLPVAEGSNSFVSAIEMTMTEFGSTAGKIAWVIALASIIGVCLMESGAADRSVRSMVRVFGEKRAGLALLISGFCLSIPVFFDTVFFLMIPLAQALAYRVGRHYVYFVTVIFSGAVITHSLVPPTPGPLVMAAELKMDLGLTILGGILLGLIPAFVALIFAKWVDKKLNLPVRESPGVKIADIEAIVAKDDSELPSFFMSMLPVALPVFLIAFTSFMTMWVHEGTFYDVMIVLGNKNAALLIGTVIALYLLAKQKGLSIRSLGHVMEEPLSTAGMIILITAGGGAFGAMIRHSGVGASIEAATAGTGISLLLVAWLVAVVLKVAQGSGTVSMITTVGIMVAVIGDTSGLPYHPIYLFAAIAFGSQVGSWMNDSGFWVVCKMSGFTESETLKTWTVSLALIGLVGLIEVFILSSIVPFPFGR